MVLAVPYIIFLYRNLGYLTISGKHPFSDDIVQSVYGSRGDLILYNLKKLSLIFVSPNIINPVLYIGSCALLWNAIRSQIPKEKLSRTIIFIIPVFMLLIILTAYTPLTRAVYTFIPCFILAGAAGIITARKNIRVNPAIISYSLITVMLASTFIVFLTREFNNHTFLYKDAFQYISNNFSDDKTVMARFLTCSYYHKNSTYVSISYSSKVIPDIVVLSNLTHPSLDKLSGWEADNMSHKDFLLHGKKFQQAKRLGDKNYSLEIFTSD